MVCPTLGCGNGLLNLRIRRHNGQHGADLSTQLRDSRPASAPKSELASLERDGEVKKRNLFVRMLSSIEAGAELNITPNNYTKAAVVTGIVGPVLGISSIVAAAELSPWFVWSKDALSDILTHPMAPLMASGVMEAGISTTIYSIGLAKSLPDRSANKIGTGLLAFSGVALSAVGLTSGIDHAVVASTYFFSAPMGLMVLGVSMYEDKPKLGGIITMALSGAATTIMLTGYELTHAFKAPYELSEAVILGGWVAVSSATLAIISKIKKMRAKKAPKPQTMGQLTLPLD